jgi:hypothetical protein
VSKKEGRQNFVWWTFGLRPKKGREIFMAAAPDRSQAYSTVTADCLKYI